MTAPRKSCPRPRKSYPRPRKSRRSGFALLLAIGTVGLIALVLALGARYFQADIRRTTRERTRTQLRQVLIAQHLAHRSGVPLALPFALRDVLTIGKEDPAGGWAGSLLHGRMK